MRPIVTIEEVSEGDTLIADDLFTCLEPGQECLVKINDHGLYVDCKEGQHYLDGQKDYETEEIYIGFDKKRI